MLTELHRATLRALVDRLIPPDQDPGGAEAGAADYILGQFDRDLQPLLPAYRQALDALDAEARAVAGSSFAQLTLEAQDELLRRVAGGDVTTPWQTDPAAFIRVAAEHAAEGFYSDPGNGGNHGEVSWRMIGFNVTG
jgi:hypothetical protein